MEHLRNKNLGLCQESISFAAIITVHLAAVVSLLIIQPQMCGFRTKGIVMLSGSLVRY